MSVRYHRYHIEGKKRCYEVICPRHTFTDGSYVVILPWFLIPGRPYPIQVYLHACGLYSSNPDMGQRGAAQATRAEFKLKKFSHSTVSRSLRALEHSWKEALERRFGEELKVCGVESPDFTGAASRVATKRDGAQVTAARFPSAMDTAGRREEMSGFLRDFLHACEEVNIEAAGRQFVENWNKKARRLLL